MGNLLLILLVYAGLFSKILDGGEEGNHQCYNAQKFNSFRCLAIVYSRSCYGQTHAKKFICLFGEPVMDG